jgi:ABC-type lipoprotein release transport system permease subunit
MRTPIAAMLWENWRLTRFEIAVRVTSSAILGAAVLVLVDLVVPGSGLGATAALLLAVATLATVIPGRRALSSNPADVLRSE